MKKALIAIIMLLATFFLAACENILYTNAKSQTTDYAMISDYQLLIGNESVNLKDEILDYCEQNIADFLDISYLDINKTEKEKIYCTFRVAINNSAGHYELVYYDILTKNIIFVYESDKELVLNYIFGDYLILSGVSSIEKKLECVINKNDLTIIDLGEGNATILQNGFNISEEGKLYLEEAQDNGVLVTFYDIQNNSLIKNDEYFIEYKGYADFEDFYVYDDCVVTNKFIFDFATKSYEYCFYRHSIYKGRYFSKISYKVEDNEGVIGTLAEKSVIYLNNCKFIPKSEADLKQERMLIGASISDTNDKKELYLQYVGYNEKVNMSVFEKNRFTKEFLKSEYSTYVKSVSGSNVLIYSHNYLTGNEKDDFLVGAFIYNIESKKITVLGTILNNKGEVLIWEVA